VRVNRRGIEGVSILTWCLGIFANGFWAAYGAATGSQPIFVGAISTGIAMACIVVRGGRQIPSALGTALVTVALLGWLPGLVWGWDIGLIGTLFINVALCVPQIAALYRTQTARGVSAVTWFVSASMTVLWALYSALDGRWVLLGTNLVLCGLHTTIALLALARHRKLTSVEPALAIASA
jgi:hypothetical protein